jgi:hypothetical protein
MDSEVKEATVLFADLSGWTDLCARIGDTAPSGFSIRFSAAR